MEVANHPEQPFSSNTAVQSPPSIPDAPPSLPTPRGRPTKKLLLAVAGAGAIALAGGFGYHWWQYAASHQETDDATVISNIHPISTRISGTVTQVLVNDNQPVKAGQALLELDPRDYQSKVRQAQAALAVAEQQAQVAQANIPVSGQSARAQTTQAEGNIADATAAIAQARSALAAAQTGVPQAQAQLAQVKANLVLKQADFNRYASLLKDGAIARQTLDSAKADLDVVVAQKQAAERAVDQARSNVQEAEQKVTSAQAKLASSQGGLQQAKATGLETEVAQTQYQQTRAAIAQAITALKDAQLQLSYTQIKAATSGHIGRKTVQVGQQVQPGTALLAIVEDHPWVVANFKETQLAQIRPGKQVEIKLDPFGDRTFTGTVNSIAPASGSQFALLPPDNATGNFTKIVQRVPVKIVFDPKSIQGYESAIVPGMSAVVSVTIKE
jgi:membrane fusion protein, multidrug efflux system